MHTAMQPDNGVWGMEGRMFKFIKGFGRNRQLDEIIQRIEMNMSNNYKDAAQENLRELARVLEELETSGKIGGKQRLYYEGQLSAFRERMKNFTHKDQKPTW